MESAMFKPITNSFTIFMNKIDGPSSEMPKLGKKKSKKKAKVQPRSNGIGNIDYIKIDYENGEFIVNSKDQFSFEKQCLLEDKMRIEYLNADEVFKNTSKYLMNNLTENWARYLNNKNPGFIKRY
jgi:hypothetical protein